MAQVRVRIARISGPAFQPEAITNALKAATKAALEYGKGVVKDYTPIDTGYLESQWFYRTAESALYNEVAYAPYVEEGTSKMEGREMAERATPEIASYFEQAMSEELQKLN